MLESLDSVPTDQLVEALYFGARLITHRKDLNGRGVGPYKGISSEPSRENAELGRRIVEDMVRSEGVALEKLSDAAASRILTAFVTLLNKRSSREGGRTSRTEARRLLNKWRRENRKPVSAG